MALFAWSGRDAGGNTASGTLEGASAAAVADQLLGRGITPLAIDPARAAGGAAANLLRECVRHADVMLFTRQLHALLKAGVPILRALTGLQESVANRAMSGVIRDVRQDLESGKELSAALAGHGKLFGPFYLAMVRVGELTGRLDEIFMRLFEHMEFERTMRDQVKAALRYPGFVIATMAAAIVIVNLWVIPAFAKVYKGFNAELPLMTKILIGFSDFMLAWWPLLLAGTVAAGGAFRAWIATPEGRLAWDRIKLRIPIAGVILRKAALARFARSFALAARSGVPVTQGLTVVSQTVDNEHIGAKVMGMRASVERGESVLRSAIAAKVFTPVVLQMVAVGEESGMLDDMMGEIGEMYQREVELELKNLSAQIEPILIVMLGILVLVLALGIFLPIWDLGRAALGRGQG